MTRAPLSTYRVQLHPGWGLDDAVDVVGYLHDLGVSHLYASPVLQSAPGSTHGYDVTDPGRVDDELGGEPARDRLVAALADAGLSMVQDIVPNHVALVTPHNEWWWDVLRHGRDAAHADHFDVDWDAGDGRVLVPVLGGSLDSELGRGTITLDRDPADHDGPVLRYHEHVFPVADGTDLDADLREVLAAQHYELAHWRRAGQDLNYRRFFDITTLGAVRVEDPQVFDDTHGLVLSWVADGTIDGLRIDHPDGLWDPTGYLQDLREAAPDAWIVVEKILEPGEQRRPWPIDGTVGYAFCNQVLGVLVDAGAEEQLTRTYAELTGEATDWHAVVAEAKRGAVEQLLGSEVGRLVRLLGRVADAEALVVAEHRLRAAVVEALVAFPVYRTYVRAEERLVDEADAAVVEEAMTGAAAQRPDLADVFELLGRALLLEVHDPAADELAMRFQQVTGPAMAKGVEDTSFYRYVRFAALNEVGGDPSRFGLGPARFHAANAANQREWPTTMLLTSSHDTKRSEDVRARLAVLSEVPEQWDATVRRWFDRTADLRTGAAPGRNLEYLAHQTLVGAWPIDADRLCDYLVKAAREEKRDTDWHDPDDAHEAALTDLVRGLLEDDDFVAEVEAFVASIRDTGWVNSLVQVACKLTAPGVPDVYQGCELWDLSLVDPDNRRAVDFDRRRMLLAAVADLGPRELWARRDEGLPKLALTRALLHLRRDDPGPFGTEATYDPLPVTGGRADHAIAFVRDARVATVVPRLTRSLGEAFGSWDWGDAIVELPEGAWRDVLTERRHHGGRTAVADLLGDFPVAVLHRSDMTTDPTRPCVWAPHAERIELVLDEHRAPLVRVGDGDHRTGDGDHRTAGWWRLPDDEPALAPGTDYLFSVDGGAPRPDPRSAWQPQGVHGPSRVVDPRAFDWHDEGWPGLDLDRAVLYELHVGAFTDGGTFDAAVERLDHLVDVGVTAVEVMPVNAFPGEHGWGYDGVGWYAVQESYGGPHALQRFVDACHGRGLAVVLDVVYNHLGPDGNHLAEFGPYFTDRYGTPWGQAVNLDGPHSDHVRRHIVDNALRWLRDFHVDALRLDAVHALHDESAVHLLEQLADEVAGLAAELGRPLQLIAESDLNDPRMVVGADRGGYGLDASWSDDLHHAVHTMVTGERDGYYVDFDGTADVARALEHGWVYDGRWSPYRLRAHGRPLPDDVPGTRLVGYVQNHDQVGNRARGERLTSLVADPGLLAGAAAVLLTAPQVPMLFMGEEWGASTPFPYVTDHQDEDLQDAVREGRRSEFAAFGWAPDDVLDPQDAATFAAAKLRWEERHEGVHAQLLGWYRDLVALRHTVPTLTDGDRGGVRARVVDGALVVRRGPVLLTVNPSPEATTVPIDTDDTDAPSRLLRSWGDATVDDDRIALPPYGVALLATADAGDAWESVRAE